MECNKDEARRAMDVAEKKLSKNDYAGAKKFVNKAQNLYPKLEGLKQVLMMIDVYISASKNGKGEADWYGILGVDPLADDETVQEAMRIAYDQKRKSKTGMQKPPSPHKPASTNAEDGVDPSAKATSNNPKPPPGGWNQKNVGMFWTMCNKCETRCALIRDCRLNKVILCPNCGQSFIATEKTQCSSFVRPVPNSPQQQQRSAQTKARNKNKKGASGSWTSVSPSTSKTQKTPQEGAKSQATNDNSNEASSSSPSANATGETPQGSFATPVINVSSPTQPEEQRSTQNQSPSQNTSGGTHSKTTSTVRFSFSSRCHCSISVRTSSNGGNTTNQEQDRSKRAFEESKETTILKKQRTDVK
ncbi:unnamed protein product [Arabis nemorensis]|uniref:J domain-containing protein n=1 Tax=Arabis nemorensis TaxID=586526 RepID=A0A565CFK5_9BRAS|nr:unnamed protein product [Arabis nemorensis]